MCWFSPKFPSGRFSPLRELQGGGGEALLTRLNAVTLADSEVRKGVSESIREIRPPKTFSDMAPMATLAKLREASVRKVKIDRFIKNASHMRALTGFVSVFESPHPRSAVISVFASSAEIPLPRPGSRGARMDLDS